MTRWCTDPFDLFRLATIVQNDSLPNQRPDALYLFSHTPDTELSVLGAAQTLINKYSTHPGDLPIYLAGGGPYRPPGASHDSPIAYSGFDSWRSWLVEYTAAVDDAIFGIPTPTLAHTGTEAENLIKVAAENGWTSLVIVAAHLHIMRAYTNAVTFAVRSLPDLNVFACAGLPPPRWVDDALSSQGNIYGSILDVGLAAEWDRLNRWHAKGDLLSARDVLEYVIARDTVPPSARAAVT